MRLHKELVVVVHGVGVREAGTSTDLLSLALDPDPEMAPETRIRRRQDRTAPRAPAAEADWRPHSSDDFHLREPARHARGGLFATFGARVRRYRAYDTGRNDGQPQRERVVADFYWGDISGTGGDLVRVVLGFVRVVLGLSHAIRENAASVWPGEGRGARRMRRLASMAALVLHGPVFALNLMLLGGLLLTEGLIRLAPLHGWLIGATAGIPGWAVALVLIAVTGLSAAAAVRIVAPGRKATPMEGVPVVAGAALVAVAVVSGVGTLVALGPVWSIALGAVGAGWLLGRMSHAYLLRHLADWLMICGVLVPVLIWADGRAVAGLALMQDPSAPAAVRAVQVLGTLLVDAVVAVWALAVGAGLLLLAAKRVWPGRPRDTDFLAAAIGLMTVLSFVLIAAVWGTLMQLPLRALPTDGTVEAALAMVAPAAGFLVLTVLAAGMVALRARQEMAGGESRYMQTPDALARRHRLIVAPSVIGLMESFLVALAVLVGAGVLAPDLVSQVQQVSPYMLAGIATVAAVVVGALRRPVAMGIDIATDVLVYLNSYSWLSHPVNAAPARPPSRTLLERMGLGWLGRARLAHTALATTGTLPDPEDDKMPRGYWLRERIQDRLATLMAELLANENPERVVIVAHSQGTVIALDTIDRYGLHWTKGREMRLVTMGSPYTHIYNRYFPASFPAHRDRPNLAPGGVLAGWTNIFRVDDFVGTHIDTAGTWPLECPVPAGGHTNYWVDAEVYPALRAAVTSDRKTGATATGA